MLRSAFTGPTIRGLYVENVQAPIVTDRSFFPNEASFLNALAQVGNVFPYYEKRTLFRFSVGRTF